MAKRENHENRTNLYEKAKNSRPAEDVGHHFAGYLGALGNEGSGTFVVKPSSVRRGKDGKTFVSDPGGTKWLPPQEGN